MAFVKDGKNIFDATITTGDSQLMMTQEGDD
jgi:hypothetical protein